MFFRKILMNETLTCAIPLPVIFI